MVSHDPKGQQKCEEAENMNEKNDTLCEWQMLRKEDVESDSQHDEQEDQQCRLPQSTYVRIGVFHLDHLLNYSGELVSTRRYAGNPTKAAAPANDVA